MIPARLFVLVSIFAFVLACSSASEPGPPRTVSLGREFELRIGEEARLDGGQLSVTFTDLLADSRCPADVTCVQEGNAEIEILVQGEEGERRISLNTSRNMTRSERYGLYRITLTQLVPYPRTDRPVENRDYGATLIIGR